MIRYAGASDIRTEGDPFVERRAKESILRVAREQHLDQYKVNRMIRQAALRENYLHYVYRHPLGKFVFEFRLHRNAVVLHSVTEKF